MAPSRSKVIAIASGRDQSLVLLPNGEVLAWGGAGSGREEAPEMCSSRPAAAAVIPNVGVPFRSISACQGTSLGIDAQGGAWVWGSNRAGLAGSLGAIGASRPSRIPKLPPLISACGGEFAYFGLDREGGLHSWGLNTQSQLGRESAPNALPDRLADLPPSKGVAAGGAHTLALDRSGRIWGWGANSAGQLGLGTLSDVQAPQRLNLPASCAQLAAGSSHSLAVDVQGRVWSWGSNQHGQLGHLKAAYGPLPGLVALPEPAIAVAAGLYFSLALAKTGRVYAWGWNAMGQLGLGRDEVDVPVPARVPGLAGIVKIAAGQAHVVATNGHEVWAWGDNRASQLGERASGPHLASSGLPVLLFPSI